MALRGDSLNTPSGYFYTFSRLRLQCQATCSSSSQLQQIPGEDRVEKALNESWMSSTDILQRRPFDDQMSVHLANVVQFLQRRTDNPAAVVEADTYYSSFHFLPEQFYAVVH